MANKRPHYCRSWRVLAHAGGERHEMRDLSEFDELVVGDWFHIERMGRRAWWMMVGGVSFWVTLPSHGEPVVTVTEGMTELVEAETMTRTRKKRSR